MIKVFKFFYKYAWENTFLSKFISSYDICDLNNFSHLILIFIQAKIQLRISEAMCTSVLRTIFK